jgi:lytic murein transglycosylase
MVREGAIKVGSRVLIASLCLGALALTPASAQRDPLAPLPDRPVASPPATSPTPVRPSPVPAPTPQLPVTIRYGSPPQPSPASASTYGFPQYKQRLGALARSAGVREATIQSVIPTLELNSTVVRLDRSQPGGLPSPLTVNNPPAPFAPYRRQHVTADLIERGAARYSRLWPYLAQIERRWGVEPQIMMAIYGHETSFGRVTGSFDLVQALATLAWDGRRRQFFEDEFVAAMKVLDRGTPRWKLKGSWAGATGYPQFMPSNVLRLATDGDGNGTSDIWASEIDALASIAAYLRDAGWKPNVHWGVSVHVPAGLNRLAVSNPTIAPRCPQVYRRHSRWLTVREWRTLGVVPTRGSLPEGEMASLLEPDGPGQTAYLLTGNYRAILDYNCSNFYALSVGLLGDAIAGR